MNKKEFRKELFSIAVAINANDSSMARLDSAEYIDLMFREFELVSFKSWLAVCKQVKEVWKTPNFPALSVFKETYRSQKSGQNNHYEQRHEKHNQNAISEDMRLIMYMQSIQGVIGEQVRQQYIKKYNKGKNFQFVGGKNIIMMSAYYFMKKEKGQVFDIKNSVWVNMSQSEIDTHFGTSQRDFWIPEHRYHWKK